jgi:triacylglycerol esterase/lipase EstA (alpha/beta hydrolase family)
MDIVFFHGVQYSRDLDDAVWKAWRVCGTTNEIWPKKWLSARLPTARILSVSYNTSAKQSDLELSWYLLGENLVADIILSDLSIGQEGRPVFLVGHSLGGIIIKLLIVTAMKMRSLSTARSPDNFNKLNSFLAGFRGVFYYSTPHHGSRLKQFLAPFPDSPIVRLLKTINAQTARINNEFANHRRDFDVASLAVGEGRNTALPVLLTNSYSLCQHIIW